jgi:ribA/ribD-fused uncharacterized protein
MWTTETLAAHIASGGAVDFLFFWGHAPEHEGIVDASCLSQWFPSPFQVDGALYPTAEHFMMAEKARLFGDADALARVLRAPNPRAAKAVGRKVKNYDDGAWERARFDAVVRGNVAKFSQDAALGAFLRATGGKVLVEASPTDAVWGIALAASSPDARDPSKWRGRNLLGFALMEARARLG